MTRHGQWIALVFGLSLAAGCKSTPKGPHFIGGTVSGLAPGNSVVLQNNQADDLEVDTDGPFQFATALAENDSYEVTVFAQPTTPNQMCTVSANGTVVGDSDVTDVDVECQTIGYPVGGTVNGLAGGATVTLHNGSDDLVVTANGPFTFPTLIPDGATYQISITGQPTSPHQTCVLTMGEGTVSGAAAMTALVMCTTRTYAVGGTVSGLGATDSVVLQNNMGDDLTVSANGPFMFPTRLLDGHGYSVRVFGQPTGPSEMCTVTNQTGSVAGADVNSVQVTCTGFVKVSAGGGVFCALEADHSLYCYGSDGYHQAEPPSGTHFVDVAVDAEHACAVKDDGSIACWGRNNWGQSTPPAGTDFLTVAAGPDHTCAVKTDHSVTCWGLLMYAPPTGTNFAKIAIGYSMGCGVRLDGSLQCWGDMSLGGPPSGVGFTDVSVSDLHACAVNMDHSVSCWGDNALGQTTVPSGVSFVAVGAGTGAETCAVELSGAIICWGHSYMGSTTPPTGSIYVTLAMGEYFGCAIRQDGQIDYWGGI
jgi:hypothetical protein